MNQVSSTCPQCVYTCVHPFVPLHTSEWAFDQRFCYFPKDNFILGHPVVLEDIWWNNYCVDRQTSTHPTQITEKKWASQSDGGALYISDSFCFIYCYQTLSQESHYFFLDFKVLLQHSLVDRVASEKLLSSS